MVLRVYEVCAMNAEKAILGCFGDCVVRFVYQHDGFVWVLRNCEQYEQCGSHEPMVWMYDELLAEFD